MNKKTFRNTTPYSHCSRHIKQDVTNPDTRRDSRYNSNYDADSMAKIDTCSRAAYQRATVSVPVAVKPFSFAGPTKTSCCGEPVLKKIRCYDKCHDHDNYYDYDKGYDRDKRNYRNRCHDHDHCHDEVCYFVFSQEICVEIPIHFGAKASVGEACIECEEASTEDCEDCE